MPNILIVLSAATIWTRADGSPYETGVWAEEFVVMDEAFVDAGFTVDLTSPGGTALTMDPKSMDAESIGKEKVDHYRNYLAENADRVNGPLKLEDIDGSRYDAIVISGGHGPVVDLYKSPDMGRVLIEADRAGKIIAPVCHGPAALLSAVDDGGDWRFAGRKMTAFSDEEEVEFGTADNAPWLLADTLRKLGAVYEKGPNWGAYIVKDRNLMTGQNPGSSEMLANAVIEVLR